MVKPRVRTKPAFNNPSNDILENIFFTSANTKSDAIQLVSTLCDVGNGAVGEEKFLIQAPITNKTQPLKPFWDSACHCQKAHLFHSLTAMQSWAGA